MNIENLEEFLDKTIKKGENLYIEFKEAKNDFPKDAMETISAFANTEGGYLILGVKELGVNKFAPVGVNDSNKIVNKMFDLLHQPNNISYNPIQNENVIQFTYNKQNNNYNIIIIYVPKVDYRNKPVYIKNNYNYTYTRNGSSDFKCDKQTIETMIRDSSDIPYDSLILKNFDIEDLDANTITRYRTKFEEVHPEHPFNKLSDTDFLIKVNALKKSRDNGKIALTVAGLLVFGNHISIKELLPHYNAEYINKREHKSNKLFIDRLIYDGTWGEDNLFNFFEKVIEKLYLTVHESSNIADDSITRISSSKLKIAIREALVNSIIHCDYKNKTGIIITRYNDNISFKNGGSLRISKKDFFKGGHSDPRNYFVQEIFRLVNLCEKAGSGIPKIMDAVNINKYRFPSLVADNENFEFILWDTSIIESLNITNEYEKNILQIIIAEKATTTKDIEKKLSIHRNTASKYLNDLSDRKILDKRKYGREYVYMLSTNQDFNKYNLIEAMYSMVDSMKTRL